MAKTNKNGVQQNILLIQGLIVTSLSFVFLIMPTVSSAFFILSILTVSPYLIMYFLLFVSAIKLRYTRPNVERAFKLPWGNFGMWLIAGVGILAVIFAFFIGFFPPEQLQVGNPTFYVSFLIGGVIVFVGIPIIINMIKKPEWKTENKD
jgi:amino acid transporter